MKSIKAILPVLMIGILLLGWMSLYSGVSSDNSKKRMYLEKAEDSIEAGLYEQAIECYREYLKYENSEEIHAKIRDTHELLYQESPTYFFRNMFLEDLAEAAMAYPKNESFWTRQIELYMEEGNYAKAYNVAKQARNYGAEGETLNRMYSTLLYMVKVEYKLYVDYKSALNGYISVNNGNNWTVLDDKGNSAASNYQMIGIINEEGRGIYTNQVSTWLLDSGEVGRARFDIEIEDAGYYNEKLGIVPVKVNGVWRYLRVDGSFLPGEFEIAGSFYGEEAVACNDGKWVTVNPEGAQTPRNGIEDVKLDGYACHIQNDIILAKQNGKYRMLNLDWTPANSFEADNVDICVSPEGIAFEKNGKWGFVNINGEVVCEPQYAQAKSFANGYAAVCNEDGLWGYIKTSYDLVVDYQFADAFYFTSGETAMVTKTEGTYQLMHFMFD